MKLLYLGHNEGMANEKCYYRYKTDIPICNHKPATHTLLKDICKHSVIVMINNDIMILQVSEKSVHVCKENEISIASLLSKQQIL